MIKVRYNNITKKVIGYYSNEFLENYINNGVIIDTENETIDGDPYIEINQEVQNNFININGDLVIVDEENNTLIERTLTDQEQLDLLKKQYKATRVSYRNSTINDHLDHLEEHLSDSNSVPYGNAITQNRLTAKNQIASIDATTTLAEFNALNLTLNFPS